MADNDGTTFVDPNINILPDYATQGVLNLPTPPTTDTQGAVDKSKEVYGAVDPGTVPTDYADVDVEGIDATFGPGEDYVSPSATVAGQLNSLLSRDSRYIKQARRRSAEASQERGLLNTSLGAGAGEAAAIEAGLPIAQQDAKTYAEAQAKQQASEYEFISDVARTELSGRLTIQESETKMQNQIVQNTFDTAIAQASDESKAWFQGAQNDYNANMKGFETQLQGIINEQTFDASVKESLMASSATTMQNYQLSVETLLLNSDILQMLKQEGGPAAVQSLLDNLRDRTADALNFQGAAAGESEFMAGIVEDFMASGTIVDPDVNYGDSKDTPISGLTKPVPEGTVKNPTP